MKNKKNKGFTLVELIVVLVILAILAAILVPALLGYIDNARDKQIVLNARSAMIAAQAEMSTIYGNNKTPGEIVNAPYKDSVESTGDLANIKCKSLKVGCEKAYVATDSREEKHKAYTINYVEYEDASGEKIYFYNGEWVDKAPSPTPSPVFDVYSAPTTTPTTP